MTADDLSGLRAHESVDQRYRELFEGALLGIYVTRPDGELLACNAAFARILGFASVAEAVGSSMGALYDDPSDRDRFVASVRQQGRLEHHRGRLRRRDGGIVSVIETVVGEFDAAGALTELRGFLLDVTASVEAELALLERERQFRAVFFDAADAMLILDDRRGILEANPSACALFGVPEDVISGASLDEFVVAGEEQLIAAWRELLALGEARREHRVRSRVAGGEDTRLVECSYRARVHGQRHLCIARDITDRRLIEERLMQAEKIESVGRLAFSRKQVLVPKDVDLNQTVSGLQSMLVRLIRADITLTCELAPVPAIVRIDPTQIEQAILNLVLNARDALPAGGEIRLDVSVVRQSDVEVPAELGWHGGDLVRLRVIDNGVGMSPEARAHLFEPFFTTKDVGKGTGLGLASVYGIVRQSNGLITVASEAGRGSVFTMHFPIASGADIVAEPARGSVPAARGQETVLLVEDDESVRVIISAILRRRGYHVIEAATARRACEVFAQRTDIDLLLTDIVMPDMNGPALAQRLIGLRPSLRVLFISGYAEMLTPPSSDNPNVGFLSKPFPAAALTARVAEMLAGVSRAGL